MPPIKINHIAVIVEDIPSALKFWQEVLGLTLTHTERNDEEEAEIAFLSIGQSDLELIKPTTNDSGIAKFLAKRGAGMHHLCIEVDDIDASLKQIAAAGAQLINDVPRTRGDGTRYAFVHPKSTGGVLVELYELRSAGG
jgi:methylmalonyl-CoA/ethylmalonyl-CoA epimerase